MVMDFFEYQDISKAKSAWLVLLFILGVLSSAFFAWLVLGFVLLVLNTMLDMESIMVHGQSPWNTTIMLFSGIGVAALVFLCSFLKIRHQAQGGAAVARMLGGRQIQHGASSQNTELENRLFNVVEEMSIASGASMPFVYVLDDEHAINACCAGYYEHDAAIIVTRGALEELTRDELQGVIAHEFSHIVHQDMNLNSKLIGWLHGLMMLYYLGHAIVTAASSSKSALSALNQKEDSPFSILGVLIMFSGAAGAFFGSAIKAAVSRQREYLADAAGTQYTRNPMLLANALKKIASSGRGSKLSTPAAIQASHLFIATPARPFWKTLFATHPPLELRIARLDPEWDGMYKTVAGAMSLE